ncbi:hypothetical protein [Engelhardtia mirabilis]|uniref:Uncharacterized protein n=1 Tax=Engelhardtia mirabilis TaxID=2528011 RepID=A0A518BF49_9BACT|nr:hypothetical protein Pla133_05880 [Planctomycetes bacterium Pla133]QDU99849.1 hypothetical protein Pla86_05880 [Planctomycetes bacterium Pla86]
MLALTLLTALVPLAQATPAARELPEIRGLTTVRGGVAFHRPPAARLPEGSIGGRPQEELVLYWPCHQLLVEADLGVPEQARAVDRLVGKVARLDLRVRVLVVDLGERSLDELDWLVWREGWLTEPLAFTTGLEPGFVAGTPGWRLFSGIEPDLGNAFATTVAPGWEEPAPALEGFSLEDAAAIPRLVEDHLEVLDDGYEGRLGRKLARALAKLEVADFMDEVKAETDRLQRDVDGGDLGAALHGAARSLATTALRTGLVTVLTEKLLEIELLLRMGQPEDGFEVLEWTKRSFGDLAEGLEPSKDMAEAYSGAGRKHGKTLERVLRLGARTDPAEVRQELVELLSQADLPPPVAARAQHYVDLIDRFAASPGPATGGGEGSD